MRGTRDRTRAAVDLGRVRLGSMALLLAAVASVEAQPRAAPPPMPAAPYPVQEIELPGERQPVLVTPYFAFYSHLGFNLYDALLTSATAKRRDRPDPMHEGECFEGLVGEEKSAWDAAVAYYADTVAATHDFSRERYVVRAGLTGIAIDMDADDRRDLGLYLLFLRAAAPAYRTCRWEERDAANRAWIAELASRLERHDAAIAERLERWLGASWRELPIPVDVVETVGWSGANTIGGPETHIQITGEHPSYRGDAALEMVFHEASHELLSPRGGPLMSEVRRLAGELGVEPHRALWHGLLFTAAGEAARQALAAAGEPGYVPYAQVNGVFRGDWAPMLAPLEAHWLPHLRGETDRETALRGLLTALAEAGD